MRLRRRTTIVVRLRILKDTAGDCSNVAFSMRFELACVDQSDHRERILHPFWWPMASWPVADSAPGKRSSPLPHKSLNMPGVDTMVKDLVLHIPGWPFTSAPLQLLTCPTLWRLRTSPPGYTNRLCLGLSDAT